MSKQIVAKGVRLLVLAGTVAVTAQIVTNDDRSNWLLLLPAAIIASAIFHFGYGAITNRSSAARSIA